MEREIMEILHNNTVEEMRQYLKSGGDPDIVINNEITPVGMAKSKEMAELLITHGADLHCKPSKSRGRTPLLWQANKYNAEVIKVILEADPSVINDRDDIGETALHYAARHGYEESLRCIKILLANDPEININAKAHSMNKSKSAHNGYTALDLAVQSRGQFAESIIKVLLEAGADTTLHKNAEKLRNSGLLHKKYVEKYVAGKKIGKFLLNKTRRRTANSSVRRRSSSAKSRN